MKYFLYKLEHLEEEHEARVVPGIPGIVVECSPLSMRWFLPLLRVGGMEYVKTVIMSVWTALAGVAKIAEFRIYAYVTSDNSILHYSVVSPTVMHLPWLDEEKAGTEIGGCLTVSSARGMKIYPHVLSVIASKEEHVLPLYMIVDESNMASQAGMKRAGFVPAQALQRVRGSVRPPRYENLQTD